MDNIEQIKFSDLCHFQPKQLEAVKLADMYKYFLYGGSRGPGKSYFLRWYGLRELLKLAQAGILNAVVGLFCEDYPSLTDRQTSKITNEFPLWMGTLKDSKTQGFGFYLKQEYGGGLLALRNLDDASKYQSAEFAAILVDELTKNDKNVFDILKGSLRWSGVIKPKFIAATNPGGKGHVWVKKIWKIKGYKDYETRLNKNDFDNSAEFDRKIKEMMSTPIINEQFAYLPALPDDNKYLGEDYWETLDSLPERLKKAWRYGDWNAFEGQFFEFDEYTQIIEPFVIPEEWNLIGSLDPGYSSPCSFSISAIDFEGNIYRIATYYESNRSPFDNAKGVKRFIETIAWTKGRMPKPIVADPSAWAKKDKFAMQNNEMTFADAFRNEGIFLEKGLNDRIQGWWALKDMMTRTDEKKIGEEIIKTPKYFVFKNYNQPFLNELQSVVGDENNPEDIQGRGNDPAVSDHALDEERYKIMAIYKPPQPKPPNPLKWLEDLIKEKNKKKLKTTSMSR